MPHLLAYTDTVVHQVDVVLKNKSADGRREQKIADYLKRRVEDTLSRAQAKHPYYKAVEFVRRFLLNQLEMVAEDNVSIVAVRVGIRGKVGVGGHHLGVDIRVP